MTSSYITTSAPDEKSPFAANVMVHLQPQPIHTNVANHQQHHVITSQHTMIEDEQMMSSNHTDKDDQVDEEHHEETGQQECENIEYLSNNMNHETEMLEMDQASHEHPGSNNVRHRSMVSTSNAGNPVVINRPGLTVKRRRLEIPQIEDEDDEEDDYVDPLDVSDEPIGGQFFGAQASQYPSVNRRVDSDREIVALRKQLMIREFELVQQKHRMEMELLKREMEYKKAHHLKVIECLNKQLRRK